MWRAAWCWKLPSTLLFVTVDAGVPTVTHPRNLIVAEESSQLSVVEDYVSFPHADAAPTLSNSATELLAGDSAVVSHYMLEREHRAGVQCFHAAHPAGTQRQCRLAFRADGRALVRNNVHPVLAGEGGDCLINGLFVGGATQHLDNYMLVEHASPHCGSRQFYNGILDDRAHGVFHGRIIVHKDAQKTDAKQTNRNLLLSDSRADRHQAAAGDLRRRREVHARRDHRPDR